MGNTTRGVLVNTGATDNIIGGTTPGAGNIIAGNGTYGVLVQDAATTRNTVSGNSIYSNTAVLGIEIFKPVRTTTRAPRH